MTAAVAVRTTSLVASAALLGCAAIAALTMSIVFVPQSIDDSPVIIIEPAPEPPQTPPTTIRDSRPPLIVSDEAMQTIGAVEPISTTQTGDLTLGPPVLETITRPHWLRRPTDLQAYYPRRALQNGVEGDVVLNCLVTTSGVLDCTIVSETPLDWGFGSAALRIAHDHRMAPAMRAGLAVEGRYRMRVPFRVE